MLLGVVAGRRGGLEALVDHRRADQGIALAVVARLADGQSELAFLVLGDEIGADGDSRHFKGSSLASTPLPHGAEGADGSAEQLGNDPAQFPAGKRAGEGGGAVPRERAACPELAEGLESGPAPVGSCPERSQRRSEEHKSELPYLMRIS